ncbi:MAG: sulfatase-like hydrolase/transferase [Verrucomicrobiota bacterium]
MSLRNLLVFCLAIFGGFHLKAADKPNFVFIVSEDNSIHYLKHFFEGGAETPNISAMAAHGLTFDHAFSNAPVCSVARSTLATACYAPRIGTQYHRKYQMVPLPKGVEPWSKTLIDNGYYTTNNSKQDYNFITKDTKPWNESSNKASWKNRAEGQPFFHMQSHGESHEGRLHFSEASYQNDKTKTDPASVKIADYHPDTPLFRYTYARYHDCIKTIDGIVGKTLSSLEEAGVLEDTFVFYFGDHGGVLPRGKGYAYESGMHVPLVIRVPENFKHLVDGEFGDRVKGFVEFVDFGPTVLHLAGVQVSDKVDGTPFLGDGIKMADVNQHQETFGYADRFDEKYDLIRTLRVGNFHYMRNFQPYLADGLQNNYRYKMLAYEEWRQLYKKGELNEAQSQFFQPKPIEQLYDVSADPHEINNLADDPAHQETLLKLRAQLSQQIREINDLSFYPESFFINHASENPTGYSAKNGQAIAQYADIADLVFKKAPAKAIKKALKSEDPIARYWGLMTLTARPECVEELKTEVEACLKDSEEIVRVRAADALGVANQGDGVATLIDVINTTEDSVVASEAFNSLVYFKDGHTPAANIDASLLKPGVNGADVPRRMPYLKGEEFVKPKKGKKKK